MSAQQAARLLQQATFGPTMADINYATGLTVRQWLDKQLALPATLHMPNVPDVIEKSHPSHYTRVEAWLQIALTKPDQLRQRVAFALSEILVTSMHHPNLDTEPLELANYYDILITAEDPEITHVYGLKVVRMVRLLKWPTTGTSFRIDTCVRASISAY